jgi:predicted DNA-binding protein with PD1-like motif
MSTDTMTPIRLHPGQDLRGALEALLGAHGEQAGFVVTGIGSLSVATLRFAGARTATALHGDLEIISLAGSLSVDGAHLHMAVSDAQGRVTGGHVGPGCIVRTTAEILVSFLPGRRFTRPTDAGTGYPELDVGDA